MKKERRTLHVCGEQRCSNCSIYYNPSDDHDGQHWCKIKVQKKQKYYANLAFYDFESYQDESVASCIECLKVDKERLEKEQSGLQNGRTTTCEKHAECAKLSYHSVNFCTALFEDELRGHFSFITFADPNMNHPDDCQIKKHCYIESDYLGHNLERLPLFVSKRRSRSTNAKLSSKITLPSALQPNKNKPPLNKNRPRRAVNQKLPNKIGQRSIDISRYKEQGVLDKFWLFFTQEKFRNYSFLAHNASGYDSILLLKSAVNNGLTPSIVPRGNKILSMSIPPLNINFLDSMRYCPGSLDAIGRRYNLEQSKGFFPHKFNLPDNYNYSGPCPDAKWFYNESDTPTQQKVKQKFVQDLHATCYEWNFKTEIGIYCSQDTLILCRSMLSFLREWVNIQTILKGFLTENTKADKEVKTANGNGLPYLHPFTQPFITFSAFIYGAYMLYEGKNYDIRALKDEKGFTNVKTSKSEMEFVLWHFNRMDCPEDFQSCYTSAKPANLGGIIPDFYAPSQQTVGFLHGCVFHGHLSKTCPFVPKTANTDTINFLGKTYGQLQQTFYRQKKTAYRQLQH